jgi:DNA-binding CsgD family transcriptional regulator
LEETAAVDIDDIDFSDMSLLPGSTRAVALCEFLQRLGAAAILVDADGEVVGLNHAAESCLGAGFQIRNRRLIMADPEAKRALAELTGGSRVGCSVHAGSGQQVVVARRNMRPLILRTVPLDGGALALFHPASAIVMLDDASRVSLPTETQLRHAFGLSDGEARLANRLAAGQTLDAAASLCGISYETARKRLKIVFEKTDTRRQSELVALITRIGILAGAVCAPPGETIRPRSRPASYAPAVRPPLRPAQPRPRSTRWTSLSTA